MSSDNQECNCAACRHNREALDRIERIFGNPIALAKARTSPFPKTVAAAAVEAGESSALKAAGIGPYGKYFRDVSNLTKIDVYRVLQLFGVTDQAVGHAIKKLLLSGVRTGGKTFEQDISEAMDTLARRKAMLEEDRKQGDSMEQLARDTPDVPYKSARDEFENHLLGLIAKTFGLPRELIEAHIIRIPTPAAPGYGEVGHVCEKTNRIAMSVVDAFKLTEEDEDLPFYVYSRELDAIGLDPWRRIEAIEEIGATLYTLDLGRNLDVTVQPTQVVYMQQRKPKQPRAKDAA